MRVQRDKNSYLNKTQEYKKRSYKKILKKEYKKRECNRNLRKLVNVIGI